MTGVVDDLLLYCVGFCSALDAHHRGEDRVLFPVIEEAHPELAEVLLWDRCDRGRYWAPHRATEESHMHAFRQAVEARDSDAMEALLAADVVFTSPVAFKPYEGKPITAAILRGVMRVFEDFHYVREIVSADGRDSALVFEALIDGRHVNGCDFIHVDDDGLIDDFVVMVRPLSAAQALAVAMGAQFEQIATEGAGG